MLDTLPILKFEPIVLTFPKPVDEPSDQQKEQFIRKFELTGRLKSISIKMLNLSYFDQETLLICQSKGKTDKKGKLQMMIGLPMSTLEIVRKAVKEEHKKLEENAQKKRYRLNNWKWKGRQRLTSESE